MKENESKSFFDQFSLDTRAKMDDGSSAMILVWFGGVAGIKLSRKKVEQLCDELAGWLNTTQ